MWKLLPWRSLRARAQFSFQRAVDVMAVSAELGHRQQGGGFRISWEVGKSSKTGPGLGTGRGGQAPGSRGIRVWQQERSSEWKARQAVWCLVCSVTACWLGLVSAAAGRQGAYPGPSGGWDPDGRSQAVYLRKAGCRVWPTKIANTNN